MVIFSRHSETLNFRKNSKLTTFSLKNSDLTIFKHCASNYGPIDRFHHCPGSVLALRVKLYYIHLWCNTVLLSWNSTGSIAKSRFWMWTWFLRNTIRTLNKLTKIYKETFSLSDCLVGNERERFYYWPIIEDCLYFATENSYISPLLDVNFR